MSDVNEQEEAQEHSEIEAVEVENPFRKAFWYLLIAFVACLASQQFSNVTTYFVAKDTNRIVTDLDFRQSAAYEEAQRRAVEDVINRVVKRVDCNSRAALEQALNEIARDFPGVNPVDLTDDVCRTTTTTLGPP